MDHWVGECVGEHVRADIETTPKPTIAVSS